MRWALHLRHRQNARQTPVFRSLTAISRFPGVRVLRINVGPHGAAPGRYGASTHDAGKAKSGYKEGK